MAFSLPAWKRRVLLPASSRYNFSDAHMAVVGVRIPTQGRCEHHVLHF